MNWLWGILLNVLMWLLSTFFEGEAKALLRRFSRCVLNQGIERLPASMRERAHQEWHAVLDEMEEAGREPSQVVQAVSFWFGVPKMAAAAEVPRANSTQKKKDVLEILNDILRLSLALTAGSLTISFLDKVISGEQGVTWLAVIGGLLGVIITSLMFTRFFVRVRARRKAMRRSKLNEENRDY